MKSPVLRLLLTFFLCLTVLTSAWGQSGGERRGPLASRFQQLDANGDGVLSGGELPKAPWVKRADTNSDGSVTLDEARRAFGVTQAPDAGAPKGAQDLTSLQRREWQIDGVARQALLYIPKTDVATPVVFAFHGHGGTMGNSARTFGYHTLWPEAIVVYMQGLPTPGMTDPEGKKPGWQKSPGDHGDRDLKFFDTVLEDLKKSYHVDANRIYATGHSNGGAFTYLLWAARGEDFAAVAPSAAPAVRGLPALKPLPALHVAGEKDELVRYSWQQSTMNEVRKINQCEATGKPWENAGPLVGTIYPSPIGAPFVTLIHSGSHKFPEQAPALIVKFFKDKVRK
ncbi:MAG: prolyl oligopeptidase family serine peptidase [Candidatus Hydrogenedentes bacterium]|nr:prolyl oligopeptidase family serine peptidase [Candidatus Hydrogenedentota bacterium]